MTENNKLNIAFKVVLIGLIFLSFIIPVLTILTLVSYKPDDYIFSLVVVAILLAFGLTEIIFTLINFKKPLGIYRIGITERGQINPIPLIAVSLGIIIALSFSIFGLVMFFVKTEAVIKCNALVILSIGLYLLINCVFYILVIIIKKKKTAVQ